MELINKAVIVSDLHLGVDESLFFTQNHSRFNATMDWLCSKLTSQGKIDELILLGDIFDLSLSPYDVLYPDAKKFFELLSNLDNVDRIVYIPGNHDHHFWISHVELDQMIEKFKKGRIPKENDFIQRIVDWKYPNDDPGTFVNEISLKSFLPSAKQDKFGLSMKYASHLRQIGDKFYLFTHGHFLEDGFTPLQFLMDAVALEDLETFNILWVESIDYHLGHSGRLSDKVREIYHECIIEKNKEKMDKFINETLEYFRTKTGLGKFWIWVIKKVLHNLISKKMKSPSTVETRGASSMRFQGCSDKLKKKIEWFISNFIINRYKTTNPRFEKNIPIPFTFVFGHTHDYFETEVTIKNDAYKIYNTGGWTVDKNGNRKDSGILVIDKDGCVWEKY